MKQVDNPESWVDSCRMIWFDEIMPKFAHDWQMATGTDDFSENGTSD